MKVLNNILKSNIWLSLACILFFVGCEEDLPTALDTSSKFTKLESIRLLNVGADKSKVLEGTINHDKKEISFPRIDPETDFSNLVFDIQASPGAKLEKESYQVEFQDGESERSIVIKVLNEPRSSEYFVKLRLKVPVFGADFEKAQIYDYTNNPIGNPIYPTYVSQSTRGGAFNGEYVFVPSRQGGTNPHLLKVSDLKDGKIEKIDLNTTGISGGTLAVQSGAFSGNHLYVFNLSDANGLKIYFYRNFKSNLNAAPEVIVVSTSGHEGTTNTRFGENTSVNLDANGNGYIYMPNNPFQRVLRLKVENYTNITEKITIQMPSTAFTFGVSYNQIIGTSEYLTTSYNSLLYVMNESGAVISSAPTSIIEASAADARVVYFNEERYLIYMTAGVNSTSATVFKVFDITRGSSISEALTIFAAKSEIARKPLLEFALNGGANSAPITRTSWVVEKDENGNDDKLMLFATATDAGFVFFEIPKKVALDD